MWQYSGGAQRAERHCTVIPGVTRMSFPRVKVPPLKMPEDTDLIVWESITVTDEDTDTDFNVFELDM